MNSLKKAYARAEKPERIPKLSMSEKKLLDYFREYSYAKDNPALLQIYRKMWKDGYRMGEYGSYLRNPSQFQKNKLFTVLRDIGFWKAGKRWLDRGFDTRWNFLNIKDTLSSIANSVSPNLGASIGNGKILGVVAANNRTKIPGFAKRAGSVVLTVMYPEFYGIIDYKVWRSLNDKWIEHYNLDFLCKFKEECKNCYRVGCKYIQGTVSSTDFNLGECEQYFKGIRKIAALEDMNPRQVDMALWEYDEQNARARIWKLIKC